MKALDAAVMQAAAEERSTDVRVEAHAFTKLAVDLFSWPISGRPADAGVADGVRTMRFVLAKIRDRVDRLRREESGQALVELAVCLPLLLMIVMGIFVFGIAINNYLLLTSATSAGTRYLAISRGNTNDPCQTLSSTISSAAPLLKSASLTYSLVLTPTGGSAAPYTGTSCTAAVSSLTASATAKVTVTYPCSLLVLKQNYATGCTLTAVDQELVQ